MGKQIQSTVVGGGLVGSLLSIYLINRGHEVKLYEKREDIRNEKADAGKSINLIVTSRGILALKNAGGTLFDEIMKITVPVYGRMMHSVDGDTRYQPYGKDDSEFNYSISRKELNKTLLSYAQDKGAEILFNHEIKNINIEKKEISFTNNFATQFEQLYATDGAGSLVRKELMEFSGDHAKSTTDFLTSDYKELYMPANEDGSYPMEKNALHIWPRGEHMLMALPNNDGSFTMTLYLPRSLGERNFSALKTDEDISNFFQEEYKDAMKLMPHFVDDFNKNEQGVLGTVRCNPWMHKESVVLLGDAAHAIVPFFGQGMNCGFEDITVLNNMLDDSCENFSEAFLNYDQTQRINANAIADMALENFVEMRDKVGDENFLLKKAVEHKLENLYPKVYRSRYALVTYSVLPYHQAQEIGLIQTSILTSLCSGLESLESLDQELAQRLISEKLTPYLTKNKIDLKDIFSY